MQSIEIRRIAGQNLIRSRNTKDSVMVLILEKYISLAELTGIAVCGGFICVLRDVVLRQRVAWL